MRASPRDPVPSRKAQEAMSSSSAQESANTLLALITVNDEVEKRPEAASLTDFSSNMVADTKRAILALESKILTTRGYLKDLQARVSTSEDLITSMQSDLDKVKSLVERVGNWVRKSLYIVDPNRCIVRCV